MTFFLIGNNANCPPTDAFHKPDDFGAQVQCQTNDVSFQLEFCFQVVNLASVIELLSKVNLQITFC